MSRGLEWLNKNINVLGGDAYLYEEKYFFVKLFLSQSK